jgi:hypothetical protein
MVKVQKSSNILNVKYNCQKPLELSGNTVEIGRLNMALQFTAGSAMFLAMLVGDQFDHTQCPHFTQ